MGSVHLILAKRLSIAAVVISILLGFGTFFYEIEKVDDAAVALSLKEMTLFKKQVGPLLQEVGPLDHGRLQRELNAFMSHRNQTDGGHFEFVEFYDRDQAMVAEAKIESFAQKLEHFIDMTAHQFHPDHIWYKRVVLDGVVYIQSVVPVTITDGVLIGYFEGVYHIDQAITAEINASVATMIAMVVAVVLATTLFLYPIILSLNRGLILSSRDLLRANLDTLSVLGGAIAKRDSDTNAHNFRVTVYAVRLAEIIGLEQTAILGLVKGAFLHDVGKIAISDTILLKPGRLDEKEFAIMQTHVGHGVDIVKYSAWLNDAADVVRYHHEKFDGSGYPDGLAGVNIPIAARIFAIADVFDALTSRRPYKEPMTLDNTMAILKKDAGTHFDPHIVAAFERIAPALHQEFSGHDDNRAETAVSILTAKYFHVS